MTPPSSPSATPPRSRALPASVLCLLALTFLGLSVLQQWGYLSPTAIILAVVSLGLVLLALAKWNRRRWEPSRSWWALFVTVTGLSNLLYLRFPEWIGVHWSGQRDLAVAVLAVTMTAAATMVTVLPYRRAGTALIATAGLYIGLVAATWSDWGNAHNDVFQAVTGATSALLHGTNPYGPLFIYFAQTHTVTAHFVYGPIVPVLAAPGWFLGDVRVMLVAAVAAMVAGLWMLGRQGSQAESAHRIVALALVSPLSVAMIHEAWVELYLVAGVVLWLALRQRHRHWAIASLAVAMLVTPITLVVVVPAFVWSRRARIEAVIAAIAAALFALPFALVTGIGAIIYDVIGFQLSLPPRYDSLTLTSAVWQLWRWGLPSWLPVAAIAVAVVFIISRRPPRNQGEVAALAAVMVFATFLVAKWAYFNYYFVAAAMLLVTMASASIPFSTGDVALPDPRSLFTLHKARTSLTSTSSGVTEAVLPRS